MAVLRRHLHSDRFDVEKQNEVFEEILEVFASLLALGGYCLMAATIWPTCWPNFARWWMDAPMRTTQEYKAPKDEKEVVDTTACLEGKAVEDAEKLRSEWVQEVVMSHGLSNYTRRSSDLFKFHNVDQW